LEVEEHLEAALRNLSLIRGIGGIPFWILKHVALDDSWKNCLVVTLSDVGLVNFVGGHNLLHVSEDDVLRVKTNEFGTLVLEGILWVEPDCGGDGFFKELLN
jgi:hypothetical protein